MLESRSDDALVLLVKLVKSTVMTVETVETVEPVQTENPKKYESLTTAVTRGHFDAWSTDQEFPIVIAL